MALSRVLLHTLMDEFILSDLITLQHFLKFNFITNTAISLNLNLLNLLRLSSIPKTNYSFKFHLSASLFNLYRVTHL